MQGAGYNVLKIKSERNKGLKTNAENSAMRQNEANHAGEKRERPHGKKTDQCLATSNRATIVGRNLYRFYFRVATCAVNWKERDSS